MYPANILSNVLLPAPEGPMIAASSPELNSPLTPCKISLGTGTITVNETEWLVLKYDGWEKSYVGTCIDE